MTNEAMLGKRIKDLRERQVINPVGVAVWKRMDGQRTLEDIVAEVRDSFSDVPHTVLEEMTAFVAYELEG